MLYTDNLRKPHSPVEEGRVGRPGGGPCKGQAHNACYGLMDTSGPSGVAGKGGGGVGQYPAVRRGSRQGP